MMKYKKNNKAAAFTTTERNRRCREIFQTGEVEGGKIRQRVAGQRYRSAQSNS